MQYKLWIGEGTYGYGGTGRLLFLLSSSLGLISPDFGDVVLVQNVPTVGANTTRRESLNVTHTTLCSSLTSFLVECSSFRLLLCCSKKLMFAEAACLGSKSSYSYYAKPKQGILKRKQTRVCERQKVLSGVR